MSCFINDRILSSFAGRPIGSHVTFGSNRFLCGFAKPLQSPTPLKGSCVLWSRSFGKNQPWKSPIYGDATPVDASSKYLCTWLAKRYHSKRWHLKMESLVSILSTFANLGDDDYKASLQLTCALLLDVRCTMADLLDSRSPASPECFVLRSLEDVQEPTDFRLSKALCPSIELDQNLSFQLGDFVHHEGHHQEDHKEKQPPVEPELLYVCSLKPAFGWELIIGSDRIQGRG